MKKIAIMALLAFVSAVFSTANAQSKKEKKLKKQEQIESIAITTPVSDEPAIDITKFDSLSYAAGMNATRGLEEYISSQLGVSKEQLPDFIRGLKEGISKRKDSSFAAYTAGLQIAAQVERAMLPNIKKQKALADQRNAQTKAAGEKFLTENKKKPGVVTLPSGLQYKVLVEGNGAKPAKDDMVKVVYEGRTIDGKVFDATSRHGTESDTFGVGKLIKGWTEALMLMPVGSKWEIYIPQELAYGARGAGDDIAPYSALIFTLELKGIEQTAIGVKSK